MQSLIQSSFLDRGRETEKGGKVEKEERDVTMKESRKAVCCFHSYVPYIQLIEDQKIVKQSQSLVK